MLHQRFILFVVVTLRGSSFFVFLRICISGSINVLCCGVTSDTFRIHKLQDKTGDPHTYIPKYIHIYIVYTYIDAVQIENVARMLRFIAPQIVARPINITSHLD